MSRNEKKVTIGLLSFRDEAYLKVVLPSLLRQEYSNFEIIVCDNNEEGFKLSENFKSEFPTVKFVSAGGNVGFGAGHNYIIKNSDSDYYLCYNSDLYAARLFVRELVQQLEISEKIACTSGKLLRWQNFPKTPSLSHANYIDTVGMVAYRSHFFMERGQGKKDLGQFDDAMQVWGVSGAAVMFRRSALEDVDQSEHEYFDSQFFMYKEDIDLMYRLRWAGWEIVYNPEAIAWHDRTAANPGGIIQNIKARKKRSAYIKQHSFLNHLQLVYKNWSSYYSFSTRIRTKYFIFRYILYLLLFDRKVLRQYRRFKKLRPRLMELRIKMPRRITPKEMEQLFL